MEHLIRRLTILVFFGLLAANGCVREKTIGGNFELTSHLDSSYSLEDSKGKVVMLFFGFTHCPDVCPNTLSTVQTVLSQLGDQAMQVQLLFITVDPKRDTPTVLEKYLEYFNSNFIGLTGKSEEIDKVIKQYGGFYSYAGDLASSAYTVDHTSNLYIINKQGAVANILPYGLPAQAITESIKKILLTNN